MALEKKDFEEIENFMIENIDKILLNNGLSKLPSLYEIELREKMIRLEGEIKRILMKIENQRELLELKFKLTLLEQKIENI